MNVESGVIVAFNTIVFVGLSLGKIFYWPKVRIRPMPKRPVSPTYEDKKVYIPSDSDQKWRFRKNV